jgi:hypothetical protein
MPLDWASVHWAYVALLSGFAFIAALIDNFISLGTVWLAQFSLLCCSLLPLSSQPIIPMV